MSKTDDTKLIERCRSGDRKAFEALLMEYEKPVFNAAYRMLNSRDDAQDVTQTVFLKVFENFDKYDPSRRFFSWIYRITLNESINWLGKTNRLTPLESEAADEGKGPDEQLASDQASKSVQAAFPRRRCREWCTMKSTRHAARGLRRCRRGRPVARLFPRH